MKKNNEQPFIFKRVVISLWVLLVSIMLWYFSLSLKPEVSFHQFINFLIVLWGSGFAYHILTVLIKYKYNKKSKKQWYTILRYLLLILLCYLVVTIGIFIALKFEETKRDLIIFLSLIAGMLPAWMIFINLSYKIKEMIKLI